MESLCFCFLGGKKQLVIYETPVSPLMSSEEYSHLAPIIGVQTKGPIGAIDNEVLSYPNKTQSPDELAPALRDKPIKAGFHALDQHVANRLTWQSSIKPGAPRDDLAVAAVFQEDARDHVNIVATDLKAVGTPASIRFLHGHHAVVHACAHNPLRCLGGSSR